MDDIKKDVSSELKETAPVVTEEKTTAVESEKKTPAKVEQKIIDLNSFQEKILYAAISEYNQLNAQLAACQAKHDAIFSLICDSHGVYMPDMANVKMFGSRIIIINPAYKSKKKKR